MLPDTPRPSATAPNESTIRRARAELAKWRTNIASPLPWAIVNDGSDHVTVDANGVDIVQLSSREVASWAALDDDDARLVVGTAGNLDMLDAVLRLFDEALDTEPGGRDMQAGWESGVRYAATLLATSIVIAADRMA